jgi:hypothetical protein
LNESEPARTTGFLIGDDETSANLAISGKKLAQLFLLVTDQAIFATKSLKVNRPPKNAPRSRAFHCALNQRRLRSGVAGTRLAFQVAAGVCETDRLARHVQILVFLMCGIHIHRARLRGLSDGSTDEQGEIAAVQFARSRSGDELAAK